MDDVAHAIADPVRREILAMLRDADLTAGEIAAAFAISRPAISRHLRVLRAARLTVDRAEGRRRVYRLDREPLIEIEEWIRSLDTTDGSAASVEPDGSTPWERRLDALTTEVHRTRRESARADQGRITTHHKETG